jgi:hypothetical protein
MRACKKQHLAFLQCALSQAAKHTSRECNSGKHAAAAAVASKQAAAAAAAAACSSSMQQQHAAAACSSSMQQQHAAAACSSIVFQAAFMLALQQGDEQRAYDGWPKLHCSHDAGTWW